MGIVRWWCLGFFQEHIIIGERGVRSRHHEGLGDPLTTASWAALEDLCRTHHCSLFLSQEPRGRDPTVTRKEVTFPLHHRNSRVCSLQKTEVSN